MDSLPALSGSAVEVAPALLGSVLAVTAPSGTVAIRLSEVEAYAGREDEASHAYRGRTKRNGAMFSDGGHLYTYRSYGIHWCCNVVTGVEGEASAVLLRAGQVIEGEALARSRRGDLAAERLARGPGNLCQALGINGAHNGVYLLDGGDVRLVRVGRGQVSTVRNGPRVGVSKAADVPLRYWIEGDPTVSAYRRSSGRAGGSRM